MFFWDLHLDCVLSWYKLSTRQFSVKTQPCRLPGFLFLGYSTNVAAKVHELESPPSLHQTESWKKSVGVTLLCFRQEKKNMVRMTFSSFTVKVFLRFLHCDSNSKAEQLGLAGTVELNRLWNSVLLLCLVQFFMNKSLCTLTI